MAGEGERYRRAMERHGFTAYEKSYTQRTLLGGEERVDVVVGSRGDAKLQVTLGPEARRGIHVVYHGADEEDARSMAERLERLGGEVEVEGQRVTARFRETNPALVGEIAYEVSRGSGGRRGR